MPKAKYRPTQKQKEEKEWCKKRKLLKGIKIKIGSRVKGSASEVGVEGKWNNSNKLILRRWQAEREEENWKREERNSKKWFRHKSGKGGAGLAK